MNRRTKVAPLDQDLQISTATKDSASALVEGSQTLEDNRGSTFLQNMIPSPRIDALLPKDSDQIDTANGSFEKPAAQRTAEFRKSFANSRASIRQQRPDSIRVEKSMISEVTESNGELASQTLVTSSPLLKFSRRPLLRTGTLAQELDQFKWSRRFRDILERASKTHDEFRGLKSFFSRKRLYEALHSKKLPLEQNQILMIKDLSYPSNAVQTGKTLERSSTMKRRMIVKEYRNSVSIRPQHRNSVVARAKLISYLKLAREGKLKKNRCFQWYYFVKEWVVLVCGVILEPLNPDGKFKMVWDFLALLLICFEMVMVPLAIAFPEAETAPMNRFQAFVDLFFIIDVIIAFQTGYYSKGVLILKRKDIIKKYLSRWFWVDLPASLPYTWILPDSDQVFTPTRFIRMFKLLRLLRVLKLSRIFGKIEGYLDLSLVLNSILSLLKLSGMILVIAHWVACIWRLLGIIETEYPDTWITRAGLQDERWTIQYISSIYWAVTTMITVGYGDITPITPNEKILTTFVMIIASGVFAFTMNSINNLLQQMNQGKEYYEDIMISLNSYMKHKHISKELKVKVKNFLAYNLKYYNAIRNKEKIIMDLLSDQLRNEMMIEINGRVLRASRTFSDLFSSRTIMSLTMDMGQTICSHDEIIFREDTEDDGAIYFIDKGSVQLYNYHSDSYYATLSTQGQIFGEIRFFTGQKRTASARSADFSGLFYIKREDFLRVLDDYPKDKQKFCMMKDQMVLLSNYSALKIECFSCKSTKHVVANCPDLHYGIQKQKIIERYNTDMRIFMRTFERRSVNKELNSFSRVRKIVLKFQLARKDLLDKEFNEEPGSGSKESASEYHNESTPVNRASTIKNHYFSDFAEQISILNKTKSRQEQEYLILEQNVIDRTNEQENANAKEYDDNPTFDRIKDFEIYFPHNNFSTILRLDKKNRGEIVRISSGYQRMRARELGYGEEDTGRKKTFIGRLRARISSMISGGETSKSEQDLKAEASYLRTRRITVDQKRSSKTDLDEEPIPFKSVRPTIDKGRASKPFSDGEAHSRAESLSRFATPERLSRGSRKKHSTKVINLKKQDTVPEEMMETEKPPAENSDHGEPEFEGSSPFFKHSGAPSTGTNEEHMNMLKLFKGDLSDRSDRKDTSKDVSKDVSKDEKDVSQGDAGEGETLKPPVGPWTLSRLSNVSRKHTPVFVKDESDRSIEVQRGNEIKENDNELSPEYALDYLITRFGMETIGQLMRQKTQSMTNVEEL